MNDDIAVIVGIIIFALVAFVIEKAESKNKHSR